MTLVRSLSPAISGRSRPKHVAPYTTPPSKLSKKEGGEFSIVIQQLPTQRGGIPPQTDELAYYVVVANRQTGQLAYDGQAIPPGQILFAPSQFKQIDFVDNNPKLFFVRPDVVHLAQLPDSIRSVRPIKKAGLLSLGEALIHTIAVTMSRLPGIGRLNPNLPYTETPISRRERLREMLSAPSAFKGVLKTEKHQKREPSSSSTIPSDEAIEDECPMRQYVRERIAKRTVYTDAIADSAFKQTQGQESSQDKDSVAKTLRRAPGARLRFKKRPGKHYRPAKPMQAEDLRYDLNARIAVRKKRNAKKKARIARRRSDKAACKNWFQRYFAEPSS